MIKPTGTSAGRASGIRRFDRYCAAALLVTLCTVVRADDITYGYDALGRLTSVTGAGATAYYDYDAAGNITAVRRQGVLSSSARSSGANSPHAIEGARPPSSASAQTSTR